MSADGALPAVWRHVRFGDVVSNVNENTRNPGSLGLERVVGLDHLDSESLPLRRWDLLADLTDGTSFTRIFKAGQVLFGKRRAYQRKVAVPDFDGICSSDILVFESSDSDMMPDFLPYVVQSDGFFDHALGTSAGSLSPRTKWQELAKYEFPLPPLDEQKRIVEILQAFDALEEAIVEAGSRAAVTSDAQMLELRASSEAWPSVPCADVIDVRVGKKLSPDRRLGVRPRPYLRAAHLRITHIDLGDIKEMDFSVEEDEPLSIRSGDTLLVEGGNRDAVAAPTFVESTPDPLLYIQNSIVRLRVLNEDQLDPRFLYWQWRARFAAGEFEREAVGTKLYHFGPQRVSAQTIGLPDPMVQRDWVHRFESMYRVESALKHHGIQSHVTRAVVLAGLLGGSASV